MHVHAHKARTGAPAGLVPDELIDVVRIRLSNPARATVLLSEFWSADRVLASWAAQPGCQRVEFEVTFDDGLVLQGCYAQFKNGKRCQPFGSHVRKLLRLPATDPAVREPAALRYCIPV